MKALTRFATAVAPVVDLVYPPRCPVCGAGLGAQDGLCAPCWSALRVPDPTAGAGIHAATIYDPVSRALVLAFKHGRRVALAPMLARMIAARLPAPDGARVLVPVPLHRWRLWHRGYNQAALLARELERLGHGRACVDALQRTRRTRSLGGMGAAQRRAELAGAITVSPRRRGLLAGADVVIVDDVYTSGATTGACLAALRSAGAARVTIACFAQVAED